MLSGAACQRRVAGRQEDQVIQVGAGQAERAALAIQHDPGVAAQRLAAFAAGGIAAGDEDGDLGGRFGNHRRLLISRSNQQISKSANRQISTPGMAWGTDCAHCRANGGENQVPSGDSKAYFRSFIPRRKTAPM